VRFEADLHLIRDRIRAHDPACWGEYLDLIKFRFFASRLDLREIVNRITGPVDSLIYEAGQADALECLQSLRDAGCPLTSMVDSCDFLIHIAARAGAHHVLEWLIHERIFNIDTPASSGTTALHHAAFGGRQHNVEFLLAQGAFVDSASLNGETPLHAAIRGRQLPIIRLLVDAGANLGATTDGGTTPLALAATYELWDCARLLLSRGAPWKYALPELIRLRGTQVLSEPELSNTRLDVCPQDRLGYLFATIAPDEARVLLERGADPGKAAEYALRNTRSRLLRLIKEYGNFPYLEAHYRSAAQSLSG
jgi:ankyrin repeat protein